MPMTFYVHFLGSLTIYNEKTYRKCFALGELGVAPATRRQSSRRGVLSTKYLYFL